MPNPLDSLKALGDQLRAQIGEELDLDVAAPPGAGTPAGGAARRARGAAGARVGQGAGAGARRVPARPGAAQGGGALRGGDDAAPRLPRQPGHRQDDGRAAARTDVPLDGAPEARSPRGGRPGRARRAVRRPDGGQDRARRAQGARRRALRRRGVCARARRRAARLRRRGDRDAAQADGGQPSPARRDRRRLSAPDAPVPRVEPGSALALLARDRLSGLLDRRARRDLRAFRGRRGVHARRGDDRGAAVDLRRAPSATSGSATRASRARCSSRR